MSNETTSTAVAVVQPQAQPSSSLSLFAPQNFEQAQRAALALASSDLVPEAYRGRERLGSCLLALDIANRVGASPLMVMQNLHVIHGRPSWASSYIIAALNSCGRFSPLRFRIDGAGDDRGCIAWAVEKGTGEILEGPPVSIGMAKAEGWYGRSGSKWKTMPELMLRYRAAAFFGRLYAPDVLMGMHSEDEVIDIQPVRVTVSDPGAPQAAPSPAPQPSPAAAAEELNAKARKARAPKSEPQVVEAAETVQAGQAAMPAAPQAPQAASQAPQASEQGSDEPEMF